ncbi:MAG: hypothetical protein Q7T05_00150 [Dehalococcoidia bacterium]|nr:hypothetical protein [Dehalococcoidia bacterium]
MNISARHIRLAFAAFILLFAVSAGSCVISSKPPVPQLFDGNWDDLSAYEACLVKSEEKSLELLQDATVYHLDLAVSTDFLTLTGREQVRYTNRETVDLEAIYFRLFPNVSGGKAAISAVTVGAKSADFAYEVDDSALRVALPDVLRRQDAVTVQVDFTVDIPQSPSGNYGLFGYSNDTLALDGCYPVIPVFDDSGWHIGISPPIGDKTFFDASFYLVRVTAPAGMVLAGGRLPGE